MKVHIFKLGLWAEVILFSAFTLPTQAGTSPDLKAFSTCIAGQLSSHIDADAQPPSEQRSSELSHEVEAADGEAQLVEQLREQQPTDFLFPQQPSSGEVQADFYSSFKQFFRGTAVNKTDREMLRFLLGDRSQEMRSWDYERLLNSKIAGGMNQKLAIVQTDQEINKKISDQLKSLGMREYILEQMGGTTAGIVTSEKSATAIPFAPGNLQTAMMYARADLRLTGKTGKELNGMSAFVTALSERKPRGLPLIMDANPSLSMPANIEYYVLSHVSAQDVVGLYVGYPNDSVDAIHWYYLRVDSRNLLGIPTSLTLLDLPNGSTDSKSDTPIVQFGKGMPVPAKVAATILKQRPELKNLMLQIEAESQ